LTARRFDQTCVLDFDCSLLLAEIISGRSCRIRFHNPVSKARDFDKNEDGASSDDIALVSPTDQQLRFCLCGLAAARRENIFGSWQIIQLTFDSSPGIGRHPTEILEESRTTSPTCSTSPKDLEESPSWRKDPGDRTILAHYMPSRVVNDYPSTCQIQSTT